MNKNYFILVAIVLSFYSTSWSQATSYGGEQGVGTTAGTGGNNTNSYFGHESGINSTGNWNTFLGYRTGFSNTTGDANSFLGFSAGEANTTGQRNTFIGHRSGISNINGDYNTFIGSQSGQDNTASGNVFIGSFTGDENTTGERNTFIGRSAGNRNTTASDNTFLGALSGDGHITGDDNTFIGRGSGFSNITGSGNVFLGHFAGFSETGSNRLYIDNSTTSSPLIWGDFATNALRFNGSVRITDVPQDNALTHVLVEDANGDIHWRDAATLGGGGGGTDDQQINLVGNQLQLEDGGNVDLSPYLDNTDNQDLQLIGNTLSLTNDGTDVNLTPFLDNTDSQTLSFDNGTNMLSITDGNNVDLSSLAGGGGVPHDFPSYPESAGDGGGNTNSFFGHLTGSITTGADNTLMGFQSGLNNTTGYENSSLGSRTLENNTTGSRNTANGVFTLFGNTIGIENSAVGYAALGFNSTGNGNTATGYQSLLNNNNSNNTAMGHQAGIGNTTGANNTYIGVRTGYTNQTGSGNVFLGNEAGYNETGSNRLYIDNSNTTSPLIWGDFAADALQFNGSVSITDITQDDALTRVLVTDNDGNVNWRAAASLGAVGGTDDQQLSLVADQLQLEDGGNVDLSSYLDNTDAQILSFDGGTNMLSITDGNSVDLSSLAGGGGGTPHDFPTYPESAGDGGDNTNAYFGHEAGINNTENWNTFMGYRSGYDNTGGYENTFIGSGSGNNNINGYQNTFMGAGSGSNNSTGDGNIAIGHQAGSSNTTGNANTYIGKDAGVFNQTGSGNVFIGYQAGFFGNHSDKLFIDNSNNSSPLIWGDFDTDELQFNGSVQITTIPNDNTLDHVLVEDANGNIYWRDAATLGGGGGGTPHDFPSYPDSAGDGGNNSNAYFGHEAGINNTAFGNTFVGYRSGYNKTTGTYNTFLGHMSGHDNTTGGQNTFLGRQSGYNNETGTGNVFLGYRAGYNELNSNRLYIDNSTTSSPLIWGDFSSNTLNFNGNVGINDETPSATLDVNGTVKIGNVITPAGYNLYVANGILSEKVKVAVNGSANWSDYVFEENYNLKSLEEVETFIKENKHLPNIPSAEEMVQEGLDVAKMDAKLLEKIEELTLYVIEINKKVEKLEAENETLKTAITNPKK